MIALRVVILSSIIGIAGWLLLEEVGVFLEEALGSYLTVSEPLDLEKARYDRKS